jgi:multidrug transporter EmrE-like cation transporter
MERAGTAGFVYILGTVLFTVYGQLVTKWQVTRAGSLPAELSGKLLFLFRLTLNPWIISSLAAAFLAFFCWVAAMTKFELSFAYPFMSLSFLLVTLASAMLFHEPLTLSKIAGVLLILGGIALGSRG